MLIIWNQKNAFEITEYAQRTCTIIYFPSFIIENNLKWFDFYFLLLIKLKIKFDLWNFFFSIKFEKRKYIIVLDWLSPKRNTTYFFWFEGLKGLLKYWKGIHCLYPIFGQAYKLNSLYLYNIIEIVKMNY